VFIGPTHEQVIQQYHQVIGQPHLPPYWSLGWHQCKYGWHSLAEVEAVVANYSASGIPLDTIWGDIDYMQNYEDFTWDSVNFPQAQVKAFADQLHANDQHYVVIVDPGIHNRVGYAPYDQGLAEGIFITENDGHTPFIGTVWPGNTAFPDFLHPNATSYWTNQIRTFLEGVPYDGQQT
jgi:alpha-glucosidase (family GH31 glycosyl hydrolase)